MKRKEIKKKNITQLLLSLIIIGLIGFLSSYIFVRFDLTAEKRYTLSETTEKYLEEINDVVYLKIYLNGDDLPYGFKKLQNSTKEMLEEFRHFAGDNIQYEFIDPFESPDLNTRGEIGRQLMDKGLIPTSIEQRDEKGGVSEKLIFSGAIVTYREKEVSLELLKNNIGISGEQNLNNSIQSLEYEIVNAINKLIKTDKDKIAFIEGHGELRDFEIADIVGSLSEFYIVDRVKIDGLLHRLEGYACIVIAKPDSVFSEKDKFVIDQFIMNGGKSLWLVDAVDAVLDSLKSKSSLLGLINNTGLDDQLFKYGFRVNPVLVQDMQCGALKINTAPYGIAPKFSLFPWTYSPLLISNYSHPMTKNLDLIKSEFVSSVDTVGNNSDIKSEFLLSSSNHSRIVNAPIRISLEKIYEPLDERYFNKSYIPVAVLREGVFESLYKNRIAPEIRDSKQIKFKEKSKQTKIIVVGDGDIIKNQYRIRGGEIQPLPLGYDRHTDMTFAGNKDFILNSIGFLLDDSGLMNVRNREIKLRLLDKAKISNERLKWQLINTLAPIIFIILFGIMINVIRRRKYRK